MLNKKCKHCGHPHFFLKYVEPNEKIKGNVFEQICASCGTDNVFQADSVHLKISRFKCKDCKHVGYCSALSFMASNKVTVIVCEYEPRGNYHD